MTEDKAYEAIRTAQVHAEISNNQSAALCLTDAVALFNKCDFEYAYKRACKSIAYSVGVFHPDYTRLAGNRPVWA